MITQDDDDFDFRVEVLRGIFGNDATGAVAVKRVHYGRVIREGVLKLRSLSLDKNHHENVLRFLHSERHDYDPHIR